MDAWCDSGLCGDKVIWELLGDALFIDGNGKMDNYLRNHSIWEPLAWLVRSVIISRGVTSIGEYAFYSFPNLTSVSIPDTVTEIGEGAFPECTSLREITVSGKNPRYFSLEGMLIDRYCNLLPVWPPDKAGRPVFPFIEIRESRGAITDGMMRICDYAFSDFPGLTSISIPDSVTEISEFAFADCTSLREITVSGKNPRYFSLEGMLIDRHTDLPIWPPEKAGKAVCRFAVNENDCVFRIETGRYSDAGHSEIACFGDQRTLIEIKESWGTIIDIECIYLKPTLHEPNLFLPDRQRDPGLEKTDEVYCLTYISGERNPCVVNVVRNKMEIILNENLDDVCCCHTDGRVEYYCDGGNEVVLIRVVDLTEEEYEFLCLDRG